MADNSAGGGFDLRGVKIHIVNGADFFSENRWADVSSLEDALSKAIADSGEVDGNEIAADGSEVIIFTYGSEAESLWQKMKPILLSKGSAPAGSYILLKKDKQGDSVKIML